MEFPRRLPVFFIFLLLFLGLFHPITAITQDLGRHFLLGKIILNTHQVPLTNLFSYTYPQFPFINLHWFSEVIFFIIFNFSSYNGLLIFSTFIIIISFSLIFFFSLKRDNIIPISIVSILYIKILFERTDIRPEIFSFLFLSIFITVLYKNREQFTKWIFILPFIELLWVNMHIYFIVGIAVIGIFLIDAIITYLIKRVTRARGLAGAQSLVSDNEHQRGGERQDPLVILILITTLSILATFINPNFANGAFYPFHVFENYGYQIEENQNIFFLWQIFQKPSIGYFFISFFLLSFSLLLSLKKNKPVDFLLCFFFTLLGIFAVRNLPLFVFGTFIAFSSSLSIIYKKLFSDKRIILVFVCAIFVWQIFQLTKTKEIGFGVETGAKNGADFFLNNNLKGPIFNNFDIGSYLDYRFYPKEKVFIDGRPGEYPASFFTKVYIPMQVDNEIFNKTSKKYNFNSIFFSYTDQTEWAKIFIRKITKNDEWKIVFLDDYIVILLKNTNENKKIIEKFEVNQENFEILNQSNIKNLMRLSIFLNLAGWTKKEIEVYQKILSRNPNNCPVLYNLANILNQQNSPSLPIYAAKLNYFCK